MAEHPAAIVTEVAGKLAASWAGTVRGASVFLTSPSGHGFTVSCRDGDDAQDLLSVATDESQSSAYDPIRQRVTTEAAQLAATNKATILHQRNRWLAETDSYVLPVSSLPADMPNDVIAVLSAPGTPSVQDQIKAWRQQLRDYPATVSDWTNPPPLPAVPSIPLPSGRNLLIVT